MDSILFIQNMGSGGIALIIAIALLFFGGKKIPELMRGLGKGIKELKNAKDEHQDSLKDKEEK